MVRDGGLHLRRCGGGKLHEQILLLAIGFQYLLSQQHLNSKKN